MKRCPKNKTKSEFKNISTLLQFLKPKVEKKQCQDSTEGSAKTQPRRDWSLRRIEWRKRRREMKTNQPTTPSNQTKPNHPLKSTNQNEPTKATKKGEATKLPIKGHPSIKKRDEFLFQAHSKWQPFKLKHPKVKRVMKNQIKIVNFSLHPLWSQSTTLSMYTNIITKVCDDVIWFSKSKKKCIHDVPFMMHCVH